MNSYQKSFLSFLVESGALKFGDFTTKSGRKTPYFINTGMFRTGKSLHQLSQYYAQAYLEYFDNQADNLYGPAYKGIPLACATAMTLSAEYKRELSFTFNRKESKDHGEGGILVGDTYTQPSRVIIIEDVITAGTSVRETLSLLGNINNVKIQGLLISIDRKEKLDSGLSASQEVQDKFGIPVKAIATIDDLLEFLKDDTIRQQLNIAPEIQEKISQYRQQWGA